MNINLTLENWAYIGTIISAIVSSLALVGVLVAWRQLKQSKVASNTTEINAIYRAFIEKCLEYPQFVAPDAELVNTDEEEFDGDPKEFRRYEVFVELLLATVEAIHLPKSDDAGYIIQQLGEHRTYLDSKYFRDNFWKQLPVPVQQLVEQGIDFDKRRQAPTNKKRMKRIAV